MSVFPLAVRRWVGRIGLERAVASTVAVRLAALLGAPVTLVLLAVRRPPEEQGLYFILTNALAFAGLFELGLGTVLVQFASHAAAGLVRKSDGEFAPGEQSTDAIQSLMRLSIRWYFSAACLVIIGLLALGTLIVRRDNSVSTAQFVAAGLTVTLGLATYVSALPITIILEGTGDIIAVQRMRLVQTLAGLGVVWILLYEANALAAVAGLAVTQVAVAIVSWMRLRPGLVRQVVGSIRTKPSRTQTETTYTAIQTRALLTWLPPIIASQALNVIALWYFGAASAGRVGMGVTLATAPLTLGTAWLYARFPKLGELAARKSAAEVREVGLTAMWQGAAVCAVGALIMAAFVGMLLVRWPGASSRVVGWPAVAALGVYSVANVIHLGLASLFRAHRLEPLAIVSAITASGAILGAMVGGWDSTPDALCIGFALVGATINLTISFFAFKREWNAIIRRPSPGATGRGAGRWELIANRLRYALVWLADRPSLRNAALLAWWLALLPIDLGVRLFVRRENAPGRRRLLVLRTDGIGDFVIFLDAARHLRTLFPADQWVTTCVIRNAATSLALRSEVFDEVIGIDIPDLVLRPAYRWRVFADIRRRSFDTAVYPVYGRDFLWGDSIVAVSGATERIAAAKASNSLGTVQRWISDRWYTWLVQLSEEPQMVLRWNAAFMRSLGAPAQAQLPVLHETESPGLRGVRDYFVVFPGAQFDYRRWPTARFAELARRIHARTGWQIVLCGGRAEGELTGSIAAELAGLPVTDCAGKTSLDELVAIIRGARFLVANDTSAAHIGAAARVPSAVVVGGGAPGTFFPYLTDSSDNPVGPLVLQHHLPCFSCGWRCIYRVPPGQPKPCITSVTVDEAWSTVLPLLPN